MSQINKKDLLAYLQTTNDTIIDSETLAKEVKRYHASNFVAQAIEAAASNSYVLDIPEDVLATLESEEYLLQLVSHLSFGRRFGHSWGLAKYLVQNAKPQSAMVITASTPLLKELDATVQSLTSYNTTLSDIARGLSAKNPFFLNTLRSTQTPKPSVIIIDEASLIPKEVLDAVCEYSKANRVPLICLGTPVK